MADGRAVRFEPLEGKGVTAITMSENGESVIAAMEGANQIIIWGVRSGQKVATIETPAPRFLMAEVIAFMWAAETAGSFLYFQGRTGRQRVATI